MAGHEKKCVERYCELANKTTQQLWKVSTPCIDDHHFKEEKRKSVGELSHVCFQIVLKCLYLARIGRLDILWSVNKLVRSITKWTKACDMRLNRLISFVHHTCEYKQCVIWVTLPNNADWDCFKTLTSREILKIQNPLLEEHCAFWKVPISWMCKKQVAVFHSSTKSEIISLDIGLRLDGLLVLTSLTRKSMWWKRWCCSFKCSACASRRFFCMCLRTMKLWSRWSLKAEVLQWDNCAQCDQDKSFVGLWWAKWSTNWKIVTTRSIE